MLGGDTAQGFTRLDLIFTRWLARAQFIAGGGQDQLLPGAEWCVEALKIIEPTQRLGVHSYTQRNQIECVTPSHLVGAIEAADGVAAALDRRLNCRRQPGG